MARSRERPGYDGAVHRIGIFALSLAVAGPIGAQPPPAPERFPVDVRLVAVPVFVTTREGKAVPALTAADFEIEDQGRKVPVAGFLAVDASAPPAAPDVTGGSRALTAAARRQFLLLFDLTFSTAPGMLKAREAALAFLQKGPEPGDLIAVASFGPGGLDVRLGFTPDVLQAAHAVATLGSAEGARLRDPLGIAYDLGVPLGEGTGRWGLLLQPQEKGKVDLAAVYRNQILQLSRAERDQYRQRVVQYVGELQRLALLLDSVQGRKQVMLLSGGFDQSVLMGAQSTEQAESAQAVTEGRLWEVQDDRHFGDSVARSGLDALYAALARSDTVVHTLDVGGLTGGRAGRSRRVGGETRGSGRETLAQIAGRSGGRFLHNANDLAAAMRDVLDASRHYYVLAFAPAESKKPPGELRKLRIKVKPSGLSSTAPRTRSPRRKPPPLRPRCGCRPRRRSRKASPAAHCGSTRWRCRIAARMAGSPSPWCSRSAGQASSPGGCRNRWRSRSTAMRSTARARCSMLSD